MTKKETEFYYKGKYEVEKKYSNLKNWVIGFLLAIIVFAFIGTFVLAFFSPVQKTEVINKNTQEFKTTN
jgi:hypothetical protein